MKKEGYVINFEKSGDLNRDGIDDKILVLEKQSDSFPKTFLAKVIILDKNENAVKIYSNENIIAPSTGNSLAEGLLDIVIRSGYFTFEDNISAGYTNQTVYTTFFYNTRDHQIYLHRYGLQTTYPDGGPEKNWTETFSAKNFGKIDFEDFDPQALVSKMESYQ